MPSELDLAIVITTAPRPVETLTRSHASLRAAGFDQPVAILADCDTSLPGTIRNDPPLGGLANWWAALDVLLATDAAWLMILEDDVIWAAGSAEALARDLATLEGNPAVGLLSLYVHPSMGRHLARKRPGLHRLDKGYDARGSQAYVLPRAAAERLAAGDRSWHRNRNRDQVICGRLQDIGLGQWYRLPGLVNHSLGSGNSSLKPKKPQDTRFWRAVA